MKTGTMIIIILFLNIVIGVAISAHASQTGYTEYGSTTVSVSENYNTEFSSEEANVDPDNQQLAGSFGSDRTMGKSFFGIFIRGLSPMPVSPEIYSDEIEKMVAYGLILFRSILYILVGLKFFQLIKNKDTT